MASIRPLHFLALGCALAFARAHPSWTADTSAESFLRESAARYSQMKSYSIEFVRYDQNQDTRSMVHRRIWFTRPFYYRIEDLESPRQEARFDGGRANEAACPRMTDVIGGKVRWSFSAEIQQYSERPIDPIRENPAAQLGLSLPEKLENVAFAPDEAVTLAGSRYDCTVVRASGPNGSAMTYWIDKSRGLPVQWTSENAGRRATVRVEVFSVEADPSLPTGLFMFNPPRGWRQDGIFRCSTRAGAQPAQK